MEAFNNSTSIRFIQRTNQVDYIIIARGNSCESFVGRKGGCQRVILTNKCLLTRVKVQHDLMHTVGFHLEHSRPDRDDYIIINRDNLDDDRRRFFGDDIMQQISSSAEECGGLCLADSNCTHFTYWSAESISYMKSALNPKVANRRDGADCGFIRSGRDEEITKETNKNLANEECNGKRSDNNGLDKEAQEEYPTGKYKLFLLWLWLILK